MKSIALRLASVGLVVGAVSLALPAQARASELDCTSGCSLQPLAFGETLGGTAYVSTTSVGSTGTGVLDPFVRLQQNGSESGHNTSGAFLNDEKAGTWTHDLRLNELPLSIIDGVAYYEFLLDADENNSTAGQLLALNNVQICVGATGGLVGPTAGSGNNIHEISCPGTLKYAFGAFGSGANEVMMDYDFTGSGSGKADLFMYIPVATLGAPSGQYVYLFSQFGLAVPAGRGDTDAGFEEWAILPCYPNCGVYVDPHSTVPEPSSLLLLGAGVLGLAAVVRRRSARA